jgi:regulator of CtrA degradation
MADRESLLTPKLLDALYTEAMLLADEARSYFESGRFNEESDPDNLLAVSFSCESLKVTTRLMHCIAWLLNQKALHSGELSAGEAWNHDRALGQAPVTDQAMADRFPVEARQIVMASEELFQRLQRLATRMEQEMEAESAVQDMFRRLQSAF